MSHGMIILMSICAFFVYLLVGFLLTGLANKLRIFDNNALDSDCWTLGVVIWPIFLTVSLLASPVYIIHKTKLLDRYIAWSERPIAKKIGKGSGITA